MITLNTVQVVLMITHETLILYVYIDSPESSIFIHTPLKIQSRKSLQIARKPGCQYCNLICTSKPIEKIQVLRHVHHYRDVNIKHNIISHNLIQIFEKK